MKNQSLILLVVAVGCGLVAMLGVKQVISKTNNDGEEMVAVLTATADIQPGDRLDGLNTKLVEIAASSVPEDAVLNLEDVAERSLKVPVMAGDWILKAKLTEKGQIGAEASIPAGMATVTIPVDATTSHSGMIRPGNRIDLLLTYMDPSTGSNQQKTITVLEFVEVFAVDNRIYGIDKSGDGKASTITLLVSPEQGKAVTLASRIAGSNLSTMMRARGKASSGGQTEISEEFLKSAFMGSNQHAPSVMDNRGTYRLADDEPEEHDEADGRKPLTGQYDPAAAAPMPTTVSDLLDQELSRKASSDPGGSTPVLNVAAVDTKNSWMMEIYEGENLRLEAITLPDSESGGGKGQAGSWNIWDLWR